MKKLMALVLFLGCATRAMSGDIYVSLNGNDSNDGTIARPLQTLHQALRQAREWRRLHRPEVAGGITIHLEMGTYLLSRPIFIRPEDSGTEESPTVIEGDAVLRGGIRIEKWKRGCNDERVAPALRSKIWTAEAPMVGNRILWFRQMNKGRMVFLVFSCR